MGQDPAAVKQEIAHTRDEMGETMEAIGYKTDVRSRAGDYVSDKKDKVSGAVSGAKDSVSSAVSRAVPSREGIKHQSRRVANGAQANPIGLAVGAAAAGFLVGLLAPSTRIEDERIGGMADQMKDKISDAGHEALERGQAAAQDAKDAALEAAREHGEQQTQGHAGSSTDRETPAVTESTGTYSQPDRKSKSVGQSA